ncbi:alpha/beta hydrolase [Enemella evansiae]|uniref:alpha/beta fold hydrolase n=1 Tax=Enemella evansiae TaxID=2016499 RepID=UPI000B97729B|nr:alpha/beta hydrolase [Enemella evansiae]OYO13726.1 alpha/beta hydrolase [Enemella evansiae]
MIQISADDGTRLDIWPYGDEHDRPVVLLAGFRAPASSWQFQIPVLVKAGYRVIAVDIRGHGDTEPITAGVTMRRRAQDVDDVLRHLDLQDVAIVGGSMGGNTIWAYTEQFGTDRLNKIVIVDQTPKMLNTVDWRHGFYGYNESNRDTFFADGIPETNHGLPMWQRPVRVSRILRALRGRASALTPAELELLGDHARADWRSAIGAADVPTLFVAGAESEYWPASHAAAAAAIAPQGSSATILHDGHAANIERPTVFNRGLLDFLR